MSRLLISTSCRHTTPDQPSGHLFVFDLDQKKSIRECEIIEPPYLNADPNPRGGFRGLKGISINHNHIAIANASTVFIYDNHWNPITYLWNPICAGIHDIILQDACVWVTSSRNDLLVCMDFSGKIINYLDARQFDIANEFSSRVIKPFLSRKKILNGKPNFRDPRTHDHTITDSMHLNSLAILQNGDMLVSCGLLRNIAELNLHRVNHALKNTPLSELMTRFYSGYKKLTRKTKNTDFEANTISKGKTHSLLVRVDCSGEVSPCLVLSGCKVPSHSVRVLKDKSAIYLNTTTGELVHFSPQENTVLSTIPVGNKFLRGADQLADGTLVLGDNNQIIHLDLVNRKVLSTITLTEKDFEAVFDIKVLPDHFTLPPESFPHLHHDLLQINQE